MNSLVQLRDCESYEQCPRSIDSIERESPDPNLEKWSEWSECSSKCGLGQQIRHLICLSIDFQSECDPFKQEIRDCHGQKCENEQEIEHKFEKKQEESNKIQAQFKYFYWNFVFVLRSRQISQFEKKSSLSA